MKWTKPNGSEIETNDRPETIEHCESLGWKLIKEKEQSVSVKDLPKEDGRFKPGKAK